MFSAKRWSGLVMMLIALISACVDQDFDAPPAGGEDPGLTPTMTIAELKAMHTLGKYEQITTNEIIRGIVTSNDEAGNFYKQLEIQDESGGIELQIDVTDLFTQYPPGRQIYVLLKDLWLGDYHGLTEIGGAVTGSGVNQQLVRLPESLLSKVIVKGTYGNVVTPNVLTLSQLNASLTSTLIELDNVEFTNTSAGTTYADAVNQISLNLEIQNCSQERLTVRSSGFASFAASVTPTGNGSITGILSIYDGGLQFMIRDLYDVDMNGSRCSGNGLNIKALRDAFNGGQSTAPSGTIQGVVISDRTTNNLNGQNLFLQDESGGIVIRFTAAHTFNLGDKLAVDVSGLELSAFHGLVQLNNVPLTNVVLAGAEALPDPRVTTVNDILVNAANWQATRLTVLNATLSGTTFGAAVTLTDASGSMVLYTSTAATFAANTLPTGQVSITGFLSEYDSPEFIINSPADITQ